jgi:CRISPR-associated protein Csy1
MLCWDFQTNHEEDILNREITTTDRGRAIQQLMHAHVSRRLAKALEKWEGRSDAMANGERKKAHEKYHLDEILRKGAACSAHIAIATHIAKATHPDLKVKQVTNLHIRFGELHPLAEVGSHVLSGRESLADTTGDGAHNAAAYELYLLLGLQFERKSLGTWLRERDSEVIHAFAGDISVGATKEDAAALADQYVNLLVDKMPEPATHIRAKQLYWLVGDDPLDDSAYQLLAPLYATSLAHSVHRELHDHRIGDVNKEARQARRDGKMHDGIFHDYPSLAVQKLGGTKPQNISHLNSERRGTNYLLSSLPSVWKSSDFRLPAHADSVFDRLFSGRIEVRHTLRQFSAFLASNPPKIMETRDRVDAFVVRLIDEATIMAGGFRDALPAGWSLDEQYDDLAMAEKLWLDPLRAELPAQHDFAHEWLRMDWPAAIGKRFAQWLNARLDDRFAVGDAELRQWKKLLLVDESEDGWAKQLHRLRQSRDAPTYIPARNTHDELAAREVQA